MRTRSIYGNTLFLMEDHHMRDQYSYLQEQINDLKSKLDQQELELDNRNLRIENLTGQCRELQQQRREALAKLMDVSVRLFGLASDPSEVAMHGMVNQIAREAYWFIRDQEEGNNG